MRFLAIGTLLCASFLYGEKLTSLGETPNWSRLDNDQRTMTASDFRWLLESQFAPDGAADEYITIEADRALIQRFTGDTEPYILEFGAFSPDTKSAPTYWKPAPEKPTAGMPLAGFVVALDPGHLGGEFAAMEFRSWRVGDGPLFREGDFVLEVAEAIKPRLEALGADVVLVRDRPGPVTTETPESLRPIAERLVAEEEELTPGLRINIQDRERRIAALSRLLFYRVAEIKARADLVNGVLRPDIVLCLHVDGTPLPAGQDLADEGYAHYLVNGAYSADELSFDDQRLQMLEKLLSRAWEPERALANAFAAEFYAVNQLPPYTYAGKNAVRINDDPFVWARNLMANRLYRCPTVFLEPYVANSRDFYPRYIEDKEALINEYADAVCRALVNCYKK